MTAASDGPLDYYAVLQVHPDADQEVIEAAYRQLMKKHHPDLAGDDAQRIAEHLARAKTLNEAYSVLRNPEQRRRYDEVRRTYGWNHRVASTGYAPRGQSPSSSAGAGPGAPSPDPSSRPAGSDPQSSHTSGSSSVTSAASASAGPPQGAPT
ncbi:MAG TPA: J domain-containing protein, partial [Chloroflexota bacterium]